MEHKISARRTYPGATTYEDTILKLVDDGMPDVTTIVLADTLVDGDELRRLYEKYISDE